MRIETFEYVWDALTESLIETASLAARFDLMVDLRQHVKAWNVSEESTAERLGITPPQLDDLLHGRIDKFPLGTLVDLAITAEL